MTTQGADGEGSGAFLKCFGRQLKLLRERAELTQAELGSRIGYGADHVASVERGRRIPKPEMIDAADRVLEAGGLLSAMKEEVARARYPAFFRDAARLEAEAVELHVYDTHIINGLLQTEDYARAVFSMRRPLLDEDTVEQRLAARMARQEIFERRPAPTLSFVIEEPVLRRPLGGSPVLRGQLEHLLLVGAKRNVEIQVMPCGREDHAGLGGPFKLLSPKGGEQVAYMEAQGRSTTASAREEVRSIAARHGIIRAQALTPRESLAFIEKRLGEL
ncbi:DNA-binding protein [Streptomyces abyssalis]|uniref:DNA-binding protein n=1 Tax=Streptomyces abyssalis TaxID=933944 RepID=A0A1E7JI20_9ACTN|nr:helix-turn-helix transcriptional regulator [Streptomyces abyssalis]OEU86101.1 DNA-binding protein [Streptomyces abyssalis]OEU92432.1 DNA-binding protein [Streptomyces abyssalis]OEV26480.1 DNA-binding protein [Streptomyces nanshensis]